MADRALVLHWLLRPTGMTRVGYCAGKSLGKAVRRNRIKRLLRESWRELAKDVEAPADLVFVARRGGVAFSLGQWTASMRLLLVKAGIIGGLPG